MTILAQVGCFALGLSVRSFIPLLQGCLQVASSLFVPTQCHRVMLMLLLVQLVGPTGLTVGHAGSVGSPNFGSPRSLMQHSKDEASGIDGYRRHPGVAAIQKRAAQEKNRQSYCHQRQKKSVTTRTQTSSESLNMSANPRLAQRQTIKPS